VKHWYLIPLAAIAGLIAGSWGPRADLDELKELQETAKEEKAANHRSGGFGAIADLANVPTRASRPRRVRVDGEVGERGEKVAETNAVEDAETIASNAAVKVEARKRVSPEDLRARIDEAAELWRTRSELAKTQWKAKLGLADEDAERFDETLDAMNDALRETMVAAAEEIAQAGKLTPELGTKLISAMTASMSETYEAIGSSVNEDKRREVSEMTLHDFIDPSVIEPFVSVQGMLENGEGITL